LILGQIQSSQDWKSLKSFDLSEFIGTNKQFFDPKVVQVLNLGNLVSNERKHSQTLVVFKSFDPGDAIVVEVEVFQVDVGVHSGDSQYLIARIVHPLQIGWRSEVKHVTQLVIRGIQLQ